MHNVVNINLVYWICSVLKRPIKYTTAVAIANKFSDKELLRIYNNLKKSTNCHCCGKLIAYPKTSCKYCDNQYCGAW